MFCFRDKRTAAIDEAGLYLRSIFANLTGLDGSPLPREVFADPYVIGFLQVLTTHAVAGVYHAGMPDQAGVVAIMITALNRMGARYGATARKNLTECGNPASRQHARYLEGRHDGSHHVWLGMATDEIARTQSYHAFREYVASHYLQRLPGS